MYVNGIETFILLVHVDVGNFLRFKSCVLYTELENPAEPLINVEVEVVAHVLISDAMKVITNIY